MNTTARIVRLHRMAQSRSLLATASLAIALVLLGFLGIGASSAPAKSVEAGPFAAPAIGFCAAPNPVPRNSPLGAGYSPELCLSYGGLAAERYEARVYLLPAVALTPPCASAQWCGAASDPPAVFAIDNTAGLTASGQLRTSRPMATDDLPGGFKWIVDLHNQAGLKVATASGNAAATTNHAPKLLPIVNKSALACQHLEFSVDAFDDDGDPIAITAENLPPGAAFYPADGVFEWPCPAPGVYTGIRFTAAQTVPVALSDTETISIYVLESQATGGDWGPVIPWPVVPIHIHLLPTGKVLFWDRHSTPFGWDPDPKLWDPATGVFTNAAKLEYELFCSGHTFLPDGRLFVPGGHLADGVGDDEASIYDPFTDSWERLPKMNGGRWYPTAVVAANGEVTVMAGTTAMGVVNPISQVWQPQSHTWRDLTNAPLAAFPDDADYYPFLFLAPNGLIFDAGPQQVARYLDPSGAGTFTTVATNTVAYREYGSSVMYAPGKVMISGGNPRDYNYALPEIQPSASVEVIDLNAAQPAWRSVTPFSIGRRQHTMTLLPDGSILATGGSSVPGFDDAAGAVLYPELFDPVTEKWTPLASGQRYRGYHSASLLLPDGRVLVTGGGHPNGANGQDQLNAEIFSPPYLFKGARPVIDGAPGKITYGQPFTISTGQALTVSKVSLVKLGSVTHAFDQGQRINQLTFTKTSDGLRATAPATATLAPQGYYLLFILNDLGVPSISKMVRLDTNAPPLLAPVGDQSGTAGLTLGPVGLSLTDPNADAVRVTVSSSNAQLLPEGGLHLGSAAGGSSLVVSASASITSPTPVPLFLTPAFGPGGTVTVTVTVDDQQGGVVTRVFTVTLAGNHVPTISQVADLALGVGKTAAMSVTIGDLDGDALTVTVSSSNPALLPSTAITISGVGGGPVVVVSGGGISTLTGVTLPLSLRMLPGATGVTTVTLRVVDPRGNAVERNFAVRVSSNQISVPAVRKLMAAS